MKKSAVFLACCIMALFVCIGSAQAESAYQGTLSDNDNDENEIGIVFNPPPDHTDEEDGALHKPGKDKPFTNMCTDCHGADLMGSPTAPSCFTCHGQEWDEKIAGFPGDDDDDDDDWRDRRRTRRRDRRRDRRSSDDD